VDAIPVAQTVDAATDFVPLAIATAAAGIVLMLPVAVAVAVAVQTVPMHLVVGTAVVGTAAGTAVPADIPAVPLACFPVSGALR